MNERLCDACEGRPVEVYDREGSALCGECYRIMTQKVTQYDALTDAQRAKLERLAGEMQRQGWPVTGERLWELLGRFYPSEMKAISRFLTPYAPLHASPPSARGATRERQ